MDPISSERIYNAIFKMDYITYFPLVQVEREKNIGFDRKKHIRLFSAFPDGNVKNTKNLRMAFFRKTEYNRNRGDKYDFRTVMNFGIEFDQGG